MAAIITNSHFMEDYEYKGKHSGTKIGTEGKNIFTKKI